MACVLGRIAEVWVSVDGGTTYNMLGGRVEAGIDVATDALDVTSQDSGGFRAFCPNHGSATMSLSARYVPGDLVQTQLEAATIPSATEYKIKLHTQSVAGSRVYAADAFNTSYSMSASVESSVELNYSVQLSNLTLEVVA